MQHNPFSARRRQVLVGATIGVGALAAPAMVMATSEPAVHFTGEKVVVSGRVVNAEGRALLGAQIEIWQADARGVRDERTLEVVTADADGRYFAVLMAEGARVQRLHYRVSHQGYTAKVTQLHANAHQRSVTLMRDPQGATRAAFEITLSPRKAPAAITATVPETVVL